MPDAAEFLGDLVSSYPLAYALCTLGILINPAIEVLNLFIRSPPDESPRSSLSGFYAVAVKEPLLEAATKQHSEHEDHLHTHTSRSSVDRSKRISRVGFAESATVAKYEYADHADAAYIRQLSRSHGGVHDHGHDLAAILMADSFQSAVKAYLVELSVAMHSIIIGFSVGILGNDEVSTIQALMVAIGFHQFFEGIGLGTIILDAKLNFSLGKIVGIAFVFSSTVSIGVATGIIVSMTVDSDGNSTQNYVQGCSNAIAAGMLIYISLTEMLAEDFYSDAVKDKPVLKLKMLVGLTVGCSIMIIMAIWA